MAKIDVPRRSRRRNDLQRMKAKAKRVTRITGGNFDCCYNNLAVCSCPLCGNPRRYGSERTMQELRADAVGDSYAR